MPTPTASNATPTSSRERGVTLRPLPSSRRLVTAAVRAGRRIVPMHGLPPGAIDARRAEGHQSATRPIARRTSRRSTPKGRSASTSPPSSSAPVDLYTASNSAPLTRRPGHADRVPEQPAPQGLRHASRIDPGGIAYGVLAVTTVIAAESTRRETFGKLLGASLVTVALYWVAHAYAHHWGERMAQATRCSARQILVSLRYEASIFAGAAAPLVVLLVAWLAGASLVTAVTTVL